MIDNLTLDVWLLVFLILTVWELKISEDLPKLREIKNHLPKNFSKTVAIGYFTLLGILLLKDSDIVNKLFTYTFSTSILGHSLWLSSKYGYKPAVAGFAITAARILFPNVVTHNVFVLAAIVWIGPMLLRHKILNIKRFLIASVIWFVYDIFYVWVTGIVVDANALAQSSGFPMGIISGNSLLGNTDLFWANLLLSVIAQRKSQFTTIGWLIVGDILLGSYLSTIKDVIIFPLLVMWIPLGLLVNWRLFLRLEFFKSIK